MSETVSLGKRPLPSCPEIDAELQASDQRVRVYELRLATPMFGGGAVAGQVDPQMPIRPSGIRGQLRSWWRLLFRNE